MAPASDKNQGTELPLDEAVDEVLDDPLNGEVLAAIQKADETLRRGTQGDGQSLIRLQIAHSLSLALADSVAQTRRLQTLAMAGQAAAQRRLLDGGDPEIARQAAQIGHEAVEISTHETLELARAALQLFQKSETSETDE